VGKLKALIEEIKTSEFFRNVLILSSGTALAQLIPLIIAPFLSRIYSPEEFGRLALYLAITQILGSLATGRYELAILLPKEERKGVQLTLLSIFISVAVSLIALIGVLFFHSEIAVLLGDPKLEKWLYLVPLSVLMIGCFNALNYFNTRSKQFKNIARANVFKSSGGGLVQLGLGALNFTSGGLILGQTLSHFFGNIRLSKAFLKYRDVILGSKAQEIQKLARRYVDFPKFSMWGIFFNSISVNVGNFFISWFYGLFPLGHYSFAYKYLGFPIILVGNSVGQVYFQKLSENKENQKKALSIFIGTIKKLTLVGAFIFIPGYFIVEHLFVFVFGEEWGEAGGYAKILLPLFYVRLIVVPVTVTNSIYEKQKISFYWQLGLVLITLGIFLLAYVLKLSLSTMLLVQVIALSFHYFVLIFIMWKIIQGKL
jgi:O-antigen/teichoic acid export membrane protein